MTFDTLGSVIGEEGCGITLEHLAEDDYCTIERMMNVSANSEVLKTAMKHLSRRHRKTSEGISDMLSKVPCFC